MHDYCWFDNKPKPHIICVFLYDVTVKRQFDVRRDVSLLVLGADDWIVVGISTNIKGFKKFKGY